MKTQGREPTTLKTPPKRRKRETFTIGFRVDAHTLFQLEKGASSYGISVHEYARQRLVELLERQDEARLLEEARAMRQSVEGLRGDVAATIEALLLNLTEIPGAEIRTWIGQNLRREAGE